MDDFKAFRIFETDGGSEGRIASMSLDELSPGDVVIRAAYSSVNYKDALAGTGTGKIVRGFPRVGGIDVAGSVVSSTDPRFSDGADVLVTGHDMSVTHDGGYAEYVRVPADWVVPLPDGLSPFGAMAIGTAGFTVALSIIEMERNGLTPEAGPVIVTGSTGGVGSIAVDLLATLGYEVTALTGKDDAHDYLRTLGAREVLSRNSLEMGTRPLEKARWAGAVDPAGGAILAWLTRTMRHGGCIASSGLTAGVELSTTVLPFILRGVKLLGIDSAMCSAEQRREVWARLAAEMKLSHTDAIVREIALDGLPDAFATLLKGDARGRFVVKI
ncbi:MAG: oxidoreductase [Vicinamibacterales bacterium]|nr:oxidoreductase [Acidobacteriota bacterium]MDP7294281.1 oxidoreductase [Vicinamibacterales bacterium]MDP7471838.1 oxidoreductase [Vicinamibacterales bacterium]MDP7672966.1 oxidoreductase [Vicinamibacterales bacterium]HJO38289.1 oxidoreductase [Vicinamibacterales bacterium]